MIMGILSLKQWPQLLRETFNKDYTCYRLGGDEFVIIGKETDQERLKDLLRTMTNSLAEMRAEGIPLPTVSYGYSIFQEEAKSDFRKTFKEADEQMYHFKKIHKVDAAEKKAESF